MIREGKFTSFEGPMGSGKTLSAVALIFVEFVNREIKRFLLPYVLERVPYKDVAPLLQQHFAVDWRRGLSYYQECIELAQTGVRELPQLKVVSNMRLNFPSEYFDRQYLLDHLDDFGDCYLLWDEPYRDIDSRAATSKVNRLFTQWAMEIRKRCIECYVCFQNIRSLDVRIRSAIDIRGTCRYQKEYPCIKCRGRGFLKLERKGKRARFRGNGADLTFEEIPEDEKVVCDRCLGYGEVGWATTSFLDMRYARRRRPVQIYGPAFFHLYWTLERIPFTARMRQLNEMDILTSVK